MRIPLASDLTSRDGSLNKDAKVVNGVIETKGEASGVLSRPGTLDLGSMGSGVGQLLAQFKGQTFSVLSDILYTINPYGKVTFTRDQDQGSNPVEIYDRDNTFIVNADGSKAYHFEVGSAPYANLYTSTDGLTFSNAGAVPAAQQSSAGTRYINWANGYLWMHVGLIALYRSVDGLVWEERTLPPSPLTIHSIVFGNHDQTELYASCTRSNTREMWRSLDGADTWEFVSVHPLVDGHSYMVAFANGFVCRDGSNRYVYTPDLKTWSLQQAPIDIDSVRNLFSVNGVLYLAGVDTAAQQLKLYRSNYGIIWSEVTTNSGFNYSTGAGTNISYGVRYIGGKFCFYIYDSDDYPLLGSNICRGAVTPVLDSDTVTVLTEDQVFSANISGSAQSSRYLMIKNEEEAFLYDGTTLTKITDADYPGVFANAVTSITRSGSTATVTTTAATNIQSGSSVTIAGATQTEYNGTYTVTVTGASTFTYTVTGAPATPATGTITATGGRRTVPGIAYLDGYFFVMDNKGVIYNCDLGVPSSYNALDFIAAEMEPGDGVAITKSQSYVVALKEWSTERFYDAANATGSPLSRVESGFALIGCASGDSVAQLEDTVFFISQTRQVGRSVHMLLGLDQAKISTVDIERVLNNDSLETVYAYGLKISGHAFYVLTLVESNITLVYDMVSKAWEQWSSMTIGSSVSVSSITVSNGIGTVTTDSVHGLLDGDPVKISGAGQGEYNRIHQAKVTSATTFEIKVYGDPTTPATGTIVMYPYTEGRFLYSKYVNANGIDLVMHESDGHLYEITEKAYDDAGVPISVLIRTSELDGGSTDNKTCSKAEIIGNKINAEAMIRHTDDDYRTFSSYRRVNLGDKRAQVKRLGQFSRRAFDIRCIASNAIQLSALELEIGE